MVEQISGGLGDLSTFDYLYPGRVVDLGSNGSLVLIYFQSCLRERILGGGSLFAKMRAVFREQFD